MISHPTKATRSVHHYRERAIAIIGQCRLYYATLPLLAIITGQIFAKNYNLAQLFFSSLSFTFIHCFESSVNNTYDTNGDRSSVIMRDKNPLVTGALTRRDAGMMNIVSLSLAIFTSLFAGPIWAMAILAIAALVVIYDLKPLRLKDTPFEILIVPCYSCIPFLFSYLNSTSNIILSPVILFTFVFYYLNLVTDVRHVPDLENDLQQYARTFTVTFGAEATRRLELAATIFTLVCFMLAVFFGFLSVIGLPLILVTTFFKMSFLVRKSDVLRNPQIWKRFSQVMIANNGAMMLSIIGTVLSVGLVR